MFDKKLALSIVIIAAVSMIMSTVVIQQLNAAPKEQKTTSHCKGDESGFKCGINSNGPLGHTNCKQSLEDGVFEERCN